MSVTYQLKRAVASHVDDYHSPKLWDIAGTKVVFKPSTEGATAEEWRAILEEWLPKFKEVGWTEGLSKIAIGDNVVSGDAVGRYLDNNFISLEKDPDLGDAGPLVHDGGRAAVFTHELIHHAHLTLNEYEGCRKSPNKAASLKKEVSWYAGSNVGEAVAEIGTGIVHGNNFPSWVHEYYEEKDGPMGAYDIA